MTMSRYLAGAFVIFIGSVVAIGAAAPAQAVKTDAVSQQEDELARLGEETTERGCRECHTVDEVTGTRRTPRDWSDMVDAMAARGVTITDKELVTVKKYLARYFGVVAVNTASAEDFSSVLGLPAQEAERIVESRKKNGKFADIAALLQVPGVDRMKIEAQPEALRFN
jgi:competence ComEA-like helix-hairpin-helix protein